MGTIYLAFCHVQRTTDELAEPAQPRGATGTESSLAGGEDEKFSSSDWEQHEEESWQPSDETMRNGIMIAEETQKEVVIRQPTADHYFYNNLIIIDSQRLAASPTEELATWIAKTGSGLQNGIRDTWTTVSTSLQSLSLPEASHLRLSEVQLPCVEEVNASNVENENDADNASADAFIGSFSTDDRGQRQKDPEEETGKVQKEADEASKGEANEALQASISSLPHVNKDSDLRPADEASKGQKEADEA